VQSVFRGVVSPVAVRSQAIEGHVADDGVTFVVVGDGHIAGDAIVGRLDPRGQGPSASRVGRVGDVRVVLKRGGNLLRIQRVDGDGGLGEIARVRGNRGDQPLRGRRSGCVPVWAWVAACVSSGVAGADRARRTPTIRVTAAQRNTAKPVRLVRPMRLRTFGLPNYGCSE
jgi:hypothetical protein